MYSLERKSQIDEWRRENAEHYNEYHRNYYNEKKNDPAWREKFLESCKEANRKYREKKKLESIPKKRGRPRKIYPEKVEIVEIVEIVETE